MRRSVPPSVRKRRPPALPRPAGLLVAALATTVALSALPGSTVIQALAQSTAPTIELVNPDVSTSTEISAKTDEDATYHLVAWVANPPADAVVQFKYQPDGGPQFAILCTDTGSPNATAATTDTYDCDWSPSGVEDGDGIVRAELYSGGSRIAQDDEPVTVDSAGQTVEIVRPRQGEQVTFQAGSDGSMSTTIDVRTSGPGSPQGDEGTQRVIAYYSMSQPGAEPAFEECGRKDTTGGSQDTVTCTLPPDDPATAQKENDPARVTAVAATAGDTDEGTPEPGVCDEPGVPLCDQEDVDAADAHRVSVPGATPTPTGTQTPTQSPTTTSPSGDRSISFGADRRKVIAGGRITFSGRIVSDNQECADAQEFVEIRRRVHGTSRYRALAGVNTDDQGGFTLITRQKKTADYVAVAPAHDRCEEAGSTPVSVFVKVKMNIGVSDTTPSRGRLVEVKSSVRPQHDGTRLVLQRRRDGRWVRFMAAKLNRRSVASFVFRARFRSRTFRTRWPSQSTQNESNVSRTVTIRTH